MENIIVGLKKRPSTSPENIMYRMKRTKQDNDHDGDMNSSFNFEHLFERPIVTVPQGGSSKITPTAEFSRMCRVRADDPVSSCSSGSHCETPTKLECTNPFDDSLTLLSRNLGLSRAIAVDKREKENSPAFLGKLNQARSVGLQRRSAVLKDGNERGVARKLVTCCGAALAPKGYTEKPVANSACEYRLALETCRTGDVKDCGLPTVTVHEVARLVRGDLGHKVSSYTIVDCRYPYEYSGGHIRSAINLYSEAQVREHFFAENRLAASPPVSTENSNETGEMNYEQQVSSRSRRAPAPIRLDVVEPTDNAVDNTDAMRAIRPPSTTAEPSPTLGEVEEDVFDTHYALSKQTDSSVSGCQSVASSNGPDGLPEVDTDSTFGRLAERVVASEKRDVIVFHCEFSQRRGPRLGQFVRNVDRHVNGSRGNWNALHYPECYLMDGGYKAFQEQYAQLCTDGYIPMNDERFRRQLSACEAETNRGVHSKKRRLAPRNALFTEPTSSSPCMRSCFDTAASSSSTKSTRALLYSAPDTLASEKDDLNSNSTSLASFSSL